MRTMTKSRKLSVLALLTSLALILSYIETFVPTIIPGAKLGLANIMTLVILVIFGLKEALAIMLLRTTISAMLFTTLSTLMYSLPAGLVSLLVMYYLLKLFKDESALVSVSMISAVSHNLTQLVVAIVVLEQVRIAYLLPWLVLMAVPTGLFVGYLAIVMIRYIKRSVPGIKP